MASLGFEQGWLSGEQEILGVAWLLPLYEYLNTYLNLPQVGPIVLLSALLIIPRRMRATTEGAFSRMEKIDRCETGRAWLPKGLPGSAESE
jgi:hypothetical protein